MRTFSVRIVKQVNDFLHVHVEVQAETIEAATALAVAEVREGNHDGEWAFSHEGPTPTTPWEITAEEVTGPVEMVCRTCKSAAVKADASAEWDREEQAWVLVQTFDEGGTCEDCDGETAMEEVPVAEIAACRECDWRGHKSALLNNGPECPKCHAACDIEGDE